MNQELQDKTNQSPYEQIGGAEAVARLVDAFYPRVQKHPEIKELFPEDITPVRDKQYLFLTQFLGGPPLYTQTYGHPMLRARHMPFPINRKRADAWLSCMREALDEIGIEKDVCDFIFERLTMTAHHMQNQKESE